MRRTACTWSRYSVVMVEVVQVGLTAVSVFMLLSLASNMHLSTGNSLSGDRKNETVQLLRFDLCT